MPLIFIRCTCIMLENFSTKKYTLQGRCKQSENRAKIKWRMCKERQSECEKIFFVSFLADLYNFQMTANVSFFFSLVTLPKIIYIFFKKKNVSLFFFAFLKPNCHQSTQNIFYRSTYRDVLQTGKYILNISRNSS